MKLGAQFLAQDFDEYVASVRKAEESGYEFAWVIDSQLLWQDVFRSTSRADWRRRSGSYSAPR